MRRPVVCQVLHSLNIGGAEILAANLARRLQDRFHFVFACLDEAGTQRSQLEREGFEVEVIGRQSGINWRCMRKLASFFNERRIDLVHAHQYTPFFYAAASGIFRKRPAVLFTEHGRWYPDCRSQKRVLFNRMMLRKRDRVVGVGEHVRRALIENEGIAPNRVSVIYNGVEVEEYDAAESRSFRSKLRQELNIPDEAFVAIQVARLDALKDHQTALQAWSQVVGRRANSHLVLVGSGPELDGIENTVRELSLESSVHLLGARSDVSRLLTSADVFLLTSISEGIPLTIIEAMVAGLPVVSTSVGGVPEVVEHEKTGLLAPAKDPASLAEAILRLAEDRALSHSMGTAGHLRARSHFSDARMNASYARMYEEMLVA